MPYTTKNVTEDLSFLVSLTQLFTVDDEGYWRYSDTNERYKLDLDRNGDGQEVLVFKESIPSGNMIVFNPFAEGVGKLGPATKQFENACRAGINVIISKILVYVANSLLTSKSEANDKQMSISSAAIRISSLPISKRQVLFDIIDDTMITEFETLNKRIDDTFIHVPYYSSQTTAKVTSEVLQSEEWDAKYGKDIRKRSLVAYKTLLKGILGISEAEDLKEFSFKYTLELNSSPRLHSMMSVYLKLYDRFNDIIPEVFESSIADRYVVDLGMLTEVIDRLPQAYAIAKHARFVTPEREKPTSTRSTDTSQHYFGDAAGNGQSRRFVNPPVGTNMPPMSMGYNRPTSNAPVPPGRFQPITANSGQIDQSMPLNGSVGPVVPQQRGFSPPSGMGGNQMGFGMNNQMMPMGGMPSNFGMNPMGGGFGGQYNFGNQMNLNMNPPSNFGMPGTR